jgi:hypothetical protein
MLRIQQIVQDGMLNDYRFTESDTTELLDFIREKQGNLREVSLRMVLKIADLKKMSSTNWQNLAAATCMVG